MPDSPELPATPRTALYSPQLLEIGLEKFGREGLWLLLSLQHYGWRAHADMAAYLLGDADPLELGEHHFEHRAMAGLEELSLLVDQVSRMISGVRAHRAGEDFLAGYRRHSRDVATELEALRQLTEDHWRVLFGMPTDEELSAVLEEHGPLEDVDRTRELCNEVLATTVRNIEEISVFFVRTDPDAGQQGPTLREIGDAYGHGTQVVYEDTSPEEIPWRAATPEGQGMLIAADAIGDLARQTVNVLLEGPDGDGHARVASVPCSADASASLIASTRHLSTSLWRIVISFILAELAGGPTLSSMVPVTWEELDTAYRLEEGKAQN